MGEIGTGRGNKMTWFVVACLKHVIFAARDQMTYVVTYDP